MFFPDKEFRIELIRHDLTLMQIANRLGVSHQAVSQVVYNVATSDRIRGFLDRLLRDMRTGKFTRLEDY